MLKIIDTNCIINGKERNDLPMLHDPCGIDDAFALHASDYLLHRALSRSSASSSLRKMAIALRKWSRHCFTEGAPWESPSDEMLVAWRDELEVAPKKNWLSSKYKLRRRHATINFNLNVVFEFYVWCEDVGILRDLVRRPSSPKPLPYKYPLSANSSQSGALHCSCLFTSTQKPSRHIPNEAEVRDLHRAANRRVHGARDTLVMLWFEETGLRRAEALRELKVAAIPHYEEIQDRQKSGGDFTISIRGKRSRTRDVTVTPMLMEMTRDYIEIERQKTIARCNRSCAVYQAPDVVFLSQRGGPLSLNYWSNIMTMTFREAGVRNASGHRLRAKFATSLLEALIESSIRAGLTVDYSKMLLIVSERLGHARLESIEPYLRITLKRILAKAHCPPSTSRTAQCFESDERHSLAASASPVRRLIDAVASDNRTNALKILVQLKQAIKAADPSADLLSVLAAA